MKKLSTLVFVFSHFLCFGQQEKNPEIVWQKVVSLYKQGKLDSLTVKLSFTKDHFHGIDSTKKFYVSLDTFFYTNKYYAIGQSILDPLIEFDGQQIGVWTYYYPSGKIYSKGLFSIGAYTECEASGPIIIGYSYKTGEWKYYYETGATMAYGIYKPSKNTKNTECGSDTVYISNPKSDWIFFDTDGKTKISGVDIVQRIINGY